MLLVLLFIVITISQNRLLKIYQYLWFSTTVFVIRTSSNWDRIRFQDNWELGKKTRSNHDVSDLQVGKKEFQKEARVPDLEFRVFTIFPSRSSFFPDFPVVLNALNSEVGNVPVQSSQLFWMRHWKWSCHFQTTVARKTKSGDPPVMWSKDF